MTNVSLLPGTATSLDDWIEAILAASDLDAVRRVHAQGAWRTVWDRLAYQPVAAGQAMLAYQQAYLEGAGQTVHDLSLVLRNDGRPVGILPLCMHKVGDRWALSSMGQAISAPLFVAGLSSRTEKKLAARTLVMLQKMAAELGLDALSTEQPCWPSASPQGACSEWHQLLMGRGASIIPRHDLFTDLNLDLASIRSSSRKSYRALINVALKSWQSGLMDADVLDAEVWAQFKQLHKDVAGRSTRSDATWQHQWDMITAREAFLITLRDPAQHHLVGGGFFQYTRDEGLYAVGAYDRALFDKPLGHAVQQRAIETLKALGVRWYFLGERHYAQSPHTPTAKEVAISDFKQGFATHHFCRNQFSLAVKLASEPAGAVL